jgi:hypothetical protein
VSANLARPSLDFYWRSSRNRQGNSSVAIALTIFVLVKMFYILLFYTTLIGVVNIGDTADYAESAHLASDDFSSFTVMLSLLSSLVSGQVWIFDLMFLAYSTLLLYWLLKDKNIPRLSKQLIFIAFLMPCQLLFLTVFSKESFVFLALTTAFWLTGRGRLSTVFVLLSSTVLLLLAKPTFILAYYYFVLFSRRRTPSLAVSIFLIALAILIVGVSELVLLRLYSEIAHHFADGRLTYSKPSVDVPGFPWWAVARITMTDFFSFKGESKALFFQFSFHLMLLAAFLGVRTRRNDAAFITAAPTVLVVLASIAPYALFNIGSYARYSAPMLLMLIIFIIKNRFGSNDIAWVKKRV